MPDREHPRMAERAAGRWLLLIHQIPPKPEYFRVKVWRRLQRLGAVAIKNSVYVLPRTEQATEDLQWVLREIVEGGGYGTICEAKFVDGLTDAQVEALFREAREPDFAAIAEEAKELAASLDARRPAAADVGALSAGLARLKRRYGDVAAITFFETPGQQAAAAALADAERRLLAARAPAATRRTQVGLDAQAVRGRTWVTRTGIFVDRIASAWLIRRFIDPEARFKFVPPQGYRPKPGELRFDMFEAEFTHEGNRCTFEVLLERFHLDDPALGVLAEIVHDIDLKDEKFGREETAGIERVLAGIAQAHADDAARLERGAAVFDDLYGLLRQERVPGETLEIEERS